MQFYDSVTITVQSGMGGNGSATGRREKYVAFGGPSGGDGGTGGSVIIEGSHNEYTLLPYRVNVTYKAQSGENGQRKDMYGKSAPDLILPVPIGTCIYDQETGQLMGIIETSGERCVVAQGGKGGLGNKHFVDAHKQFSTIALLGEPAQKLPIRLELQLLADVAFIGAPSVGKSSLINTISNTKAKVAEYHFTTITPNLGIVKHHNKTFSAIDIPGLIAGAHTGKGLGYEFLRHILKSRILLFTCALDRFENGIAELIAILEEFRLYCIDYYTNTTEKEIEATLIQENKTLYLLITDQDDTIYTKKAIGFLINKIDLIVDEEIQEEFVSETINTLQEYFSETYAESITNKILLNHLFLVSAGTRQGVDTMLDFCVNTIETIDATTDTSISYKELPETIEETIEFRDVTQETLPSLIEEGYIPDDLAINPKVWYSKHPQLSYLAFVLPWGNDEAELRFWKQCADLGITKILLDLGAKKGDVLKIYSPYRQLDDLIIKRE